MQDVANVSQAEDMDFSDMITPEEFAKFKELEAKIKKQKQQAGAFKGKVFEELTTEFGSLMSSLVKQQVTISTKEAYSSLSTLNCKRTIFI